ncbi:sugar-binding domain-containing protein [Flavicella sediminum]|uniref:sugar-binding domain-containing protein n=1 Tax=Flavicella sediminum TaxID=2585141 RepID=UPI0011245A06|nr:sugar-binding domain-containing protein [Flavicella sediminum]
MKFVLLFFFILAFNGCNKEEKSYINLSGNWQFRIDSLDKGMDEKWYDTTLTDIVYLPGSMAENRKGNEVTAATKWTGNMWNDSLWYKADDMKKYRQNGNIKVPFWLTPVKEYKGAAWYQKKVNIPKSWNEKHINLNLERVHWESTVWVDKQKIGTKNSLATAHNYNLNDLLTAGEHIITIRVDNRVKDIDVGVDAHSISDNTQSNWNGIVGTIVLTAQSKVSMGNVKLYPNIHSKKVKVVVQIENYTEQNQKGQLIFEAKEKSINGLKLQSLKKEFEIKENNEVVVEYSMGDNPKLWDEFSPNVYEMQLTLKTNVGIDTKNVDFGMRDFKAQGTRFTINERPLFLRGTLECAIFPLTGYPPTNVDAWKRILKIIQDHGLNHMRFHSWCPPEAAFIAADELGVYLQVEASAWTTIGDGAPIDQWLYKEAEAIINTYGNHPSFVLMAYGNEPGGKNHSEYLKKFVSHLKSFDNRRLYTGGAGWPYFEELDYYNNRNPRIQGWNENLKSIINSEPPQTEFDWSRFIDKTPMPYVSHEMGQWCAYPNFKEMSKYRGVLKPKNFEIFKESLKENNLLELADSLLLASGKLQTLCYKSDIEAALRTKGMAGFQLLDLHDFPGQGTALVGVLDAFWDEKGYVSPKEFSQFNNETVPLARLKKRVFRNTENFVAKIEVANFGANELKNITPLWRLSNSKGQIFKEGRLNKLDISIGNTIRLGEITTSLTEIIKAQKLTLTVQILDFINTWDIWVYPAKYDEIENENRIKVVNKLESSTISFLENGGKVLLNIAKGNVAVAKGGDIGVGFSSIFWNTSWTKGQKPHTLGILCNPAHPALANFPTEYHSNWQWWDAMSNSNAIVLDDFPNTLTPIVRLIDDWFKNRKTALIFEAKVGNGSILISGIDLHTDLENRLEAKQLLYSLKAYMVSTRFKPKTLLKINQVESIIK